MSEKVNISSYTIQEKWLNEVAPNYFNIDDINKLKIGLFGYVNEAMANVTEDSLYMHSILSKEIFPNKAVLPDSIYAYASLANFDDFYATPATFSFVLALKKSDILKYSETNYTNGNKEFYISRNSELLIENTIPFILDYDIKIICRPKNYSSSLVGKTDYIISAQYIMTENNALSNINSPFIQTILLVEDGIEYVFLSLQGKQLSRKETSFLIYTNDIVENISFEVDFDDQLAGFNVYYKESSDSSEKILLNKYLDCSTTPSSGENFCFFTLSAEHKIKISFSAHPSYFRPKFNSELLIETFSTLGSKGNFTYDGTNITMELKPIDEYLNYKNILTEIEPVSNSTNGKDSPDLATIKEKVIQEFSTRKNIITENDLKTSFNSISDSCDVTFIKKRDDILKRVYTAFILMRNSEKEIIPTNTIDFLIYEDEFDNYSKGVDELIIKAGTVFEASDNDNNFTKINHLYNWSELVQKDSQPTNYLYGTPFLIKVNKSPLFLSYYLNSIFEDYKLNYSYMNENSYEEFVVNSFSISRNAIKSDSYRLQTTITTSMENDTDKIKVIGFIEESGVVTGYIKFNPINSFEGKIHLEAYLDTDDVINSDNELLIKNSIYSVNHYGQENLKSNFAVAPNNVKIIIGVYYSGYNDNKDKGSFSLFVPGMENYALCNAYKTEKDIKLFKELNSVMQSNILLRTNDNINHTGVYYKIKKSPMVRYLYLENEDNMIEIIKLYDNIYEKLKSMLPNMENNFSVDTKFYNTYGSSNFFTIGRSKQNLNIVCISLKLNIKLAVESSAYLVNEIKKFIVQFVEDTNKAETNYIYVSNLIRSLEQEFKEIVYIEFLGFNDYGPSEQIIENNFTDLSDLTKEQVINYVPEYLNINRHVVLDNGQLVFEPRITINFV